MVKTNLKLWEKLSNFSLDNPEASFSFSDRLARENNWSIDYAKRVIDEYKKFIYMSVISGKSLTPSDEVDQAWHMHLIYSHSYWVEMCKNLLNGFNLHHGPTKGGVVEKTKYNNQYNETLDFYLDEFGYRPPRDIWPSNEVRFGKINFRRVSINDNYILNKDKVKKYTLSLATLLLSFLGAVLFSSAKPSDSEVDISVVILTVLIAIGVFFLIRGIYRYSTRSSRSNRYNNTSGKNSSSSSSSSTDSGCTIISSFFGCGSDSDSGSSGCGSSGCGGCGGCGS